MSTAPFPDGFDAAAAIRGLVALIYEEFPRHSLEELAGTYLWSEGKAATVEALRLVDAWLDADDDDDEGQSDDADDDLPAGTTTANRAATSSLSTASQVLRPGFHVAATAERGLYCEMRVDRHARLRPSTSA